MSQSDYYIAQHVLIARRAHKSMICALKGGDEGGYWRGLAEVARVLKILDASTNTSHHADLARHGLFNDAVPVLWPPKKKIKKTKVDFAIAA